jgi:hypothetical protein
LQGVQRCCYSGELCSDGLEVGVHWA